jgi:hypothetical protein
MGAVKAKTYKLFSKLINFFSNNKTRPLSV